MTTAAITPVWIKYSQINKRLQYLILDMQNKTSNVFIKWELQSSHCVKGLSFAKSTQKKTPLHENAFEKFNLIGEEAIATKGKPMFELEFLQKLLYLNPHPFQWQLSPEQVDSDRRPENFYKSQTKHWWKVTLMQ